MASNTPAAAIEARLIANWSTTPIYLADDLHDPPEPPSPFVVLEFPGGTARQVTIGSPGANAFEEEGAFMIHVFVPIGNQPVTGTPWRKVARDYAETIAAIFRGKTFSSVRTYAPFPPNESDRAIGNFYSVSFATPFLYSYLG